MDLIFVEEAANKLSIPRSLINYYVEKGLLALTGDSGRQLTSYEFDELCKIVQVSHQVVRRHERTLHR